LRLESQRTKSTIIREWNAIGLRHFVWNGTATFVGLGWNTMGSFESKSFGTFFFRFPSVILFQHCLCLVGVLWLLACVRVVSCVSLIASVSADINLSAVLDN